MTNNNNQNEQDSTQVVVDFFKTFKWRIIGFLAFLIIAILFLLFGLLEENLGLLVAFLGLMCLFVPYILHYYLLENNVQKMYYQYDKLLKK